MMKAYPILWRRQEREWVRKRLEEVLFGTESLFFFLSTLKDKLRQEQEGQVSSPSHTTSKKLKAIKDAHKEDGYFFRKF